MAKTDLWHTCGDTKCRLINNVHVNNDIGRGFMGISVSISKKKYMFDLQRGHRHLRVFFQIIYPCESNKFTFKINYGFIYHTYGGKKPWLGFGYKNYSKISVRCCDSVSICNLKMHSTEEPFRKKIIQTFKPIYLLV